MFLASGSPVRTPGRLATVPLFCLLLACGGGGDGSAPSPTGDRLPADFDGQELLALVGNLDVVKTVENEIELEVLRWKVEANDQRETISALVWVRFDTGSQQDWMLAHVIRTAGADGPESPWSLARYSGTPQVSHEYYSEAPGADDVARFQRATWWEDEATSGNRLVDSAVRRQAWTAAIGAPPPAGG